MNTCHNESRQVARQKKNKPPANPVVRGILAFYQQQPQVGTISDDSSLSEEGDIQNQSSTPILTNDLAVEGSTGTNSPNPPSMLSISDLPKRYTIYPPLLLLPFKFPVHSPQWADFYKALDDSERQELFRCIAEEGFRRTGISRIAINAPIAAEMEAGDRDDTAPATTTTTTTREPSYESADDSDKTRRGQENVLRSPSGLVPVYGDWGPRFPSERHRSRILDPTTQDFDEAFWTSTSQHKGITQCWAPLYTMFSRGNLSEKARILGLQSLFPGLSTYELGHGEKIGNGDVVDFYVGIGYFAFCYLKRGIRRVYGWDINSWSIEGLRRGCERNRWGCLVVKVDEMGEIKGAGGARELAERIQQGDETGSEEKVVRCVAFLGDNKWAVKVLKEIQIEFTRMENNGWVIPPDLNVRHANLGLLPTSKASWEDAVRVLTCLSRRGRGGWVHVHENVDVREIDHKAKEVSDEIDELVRGESGGPSFIVSNAHIEQVKTYAPGVLHCVFDIEIRSHG